MRLYTLFLLVSLGTASLAQTLERETCDPKRMMVDVEVDNANALIGGLFEMRIGAADGYGCGEPHSEVMLAYEAARWAIRRINQNNYIPGVKLGMKAYDTCYSPYNAVAAANNFYPQYSSSSIYCNETGKVNLGLLGAMTSWTTRPVAEMTSKFPASMISQVASSPVLSDKSRYPYFMRTGLSSSEQIKSMIAAMTSMSWKRILIVYSDNDYGLDAMREFVRLSQDKDVCVVAALSVPGTPDLTTYLEKLQNIGTYDVTGAVYFGDHYSMLKVMDAVQNTPNPKVASIQWMLSSVNLNDYFLSPRMQGTIFVQPQFTEVTEFFDYFTTSIDENAPPAENPWYQDWFMKTFQCKLAGINYAPYNAYSSCNSKTPEQKRNAANTKYAFVDSTIKAVYAYAKALKNAQTAICGFGDGLCAGLQQMSPQVFNGYLKNVNFNFNEVGITSLQGVTVGFDANGDSLTSGHMFWNYNNQPSGLFSFKMVGTYANNMLNVDFAKVFMYSNDRSTLLQSLPSSPCPANGCKNCMVPRLEVKFSYTPGDVVIAGIFDIHAQGSEVLTCGQLKANHALNAAAFRYAIRNVQQEFNILKGINLGSLIVDLCDSAEMGRLLLNNVLGGRAIVSDMQGQVVDANDVKGVVGELDSTEAISMAGMLGTYMMPYVDSSATSTSLSQRMLYPTFSRTVPSDFHQMLAIVLMLNRMNWKYVQVVHTADAYGRSGYQNIKDEGARRSICVAASHEVGTDGNYATIVSNLQNKPDAKVVIAIVDSSDIRSLLEEIQRQGVKGQFVLIGTETWGRSSSVVSGLQSVAEGSITLSINSPQLTKLNNWLDSLNPSDPTTIRDMPFFIEWYQHAFNCYLDATNHGVYQDECTTGQRISTAPNFADSVYTPFTISATYVVARALDATLTDYCGVDYNGVCWQFRSSPGVMAKLLGHIRNHEYLLDNTEFKMKEGEGQSSYQFYSYSNGAYQPIGTYVTERMELQMDFSSPMSLPPNFQSQCFGKCSECAYLLQTNPFVLIPGPQLKIGVNMAGHDPDNKDPFLCGDLRLTNGIQSALAIGFAIKEVNRGMAPVRLNNITLGALMFDHCNSEARANGLPSALYSGLIEGKDTAENKPNLNTIRAWVTDNTLVTEQMKDLFSDLNLPVISPMASSNKFLNEEEYPTFVRTIQGDSTIATALAVLAKSLGLDYVTVLYSSNGFGRGGMEAFAGIAQQEGICIISMLEVGNSSMANIVSILLGESTHAVVAYLDMADMDAFLEAKGNHPNRDDLVVISPEPYPLIYSRRGMAAKNLISLRMKATELDSFRNFVSNFTMQDTMMNPNMAEYYQDIFKCNLPGQYKYDTPCSSNKVTSSPDFYVDNYILPFINAVYTFVAAAHETLQIQCGGPLYSGVCTKFYSDPETNTILYNKLTEVGFVDTSGARFQFTGKEGNTGREIVLFNGQQMTKVADFAGASINFVEKSFQTSFDGIKSTCVLPCTQCINNMMNFTYIPGDILLGGLFDVHESSLTPFSCGNINTLAGFQLLEAFHFALDKVNDKTGKFAQILKNIKLGGVGLDACQSGVRGGYIVSNIHNGITSLMRDGLIVNPDSIDAYLGTYSSGRSIYLARLLKTLKMPQVSYGSTSIELLDQDRYPYFLRTVPADDKQAKAMLTFLREYDIRYVQVVHTADNYGEQGAKIFNELAVNNTVCVAQTISFPDKAAVTTESANDVVLALLQKPIANTVVIFADATYINELLRAIRRNPGAMNKFKFIGSDSWANNVQSTEGVEDIAVGSVTLDLDAVDLREFDGYLASKTPANYPENPWFPEYYEEIQNCYLTIPDARYPEKCQASPKNIVTSQRYKQDTVIIHVINAVYSSAIGIDQALRQVCGEDYTTVCEAFKNMDGRRDLVLQEIKKARFTDLSGQEFSFSDRGDSNKGYVMYSIDTSNIFGYVYNPIAKSSNGSQLVMTKPDYKPSWDGSCEREGSCTECPTIRNLQTRYMLPAYNGNDNPATLVFMTGIHRQGNDEYRCGEMNVGRLLEALSVFYTVQTILPSHPFNLRTLILDNCYNPLRIDQDLFNILSTGKLCNAKFNSDRVINASSIVGVQVHSSTSVVAANRVLAPMKIQLLSHAASSTALSDQWRYPFFARTVPPDNIQMEVVANILKENDWTYVSVLYSSESYGINGYRSLRDIVNKKMYSCIGYSEVVTPYGVVGDYRAAVRRMAEINSINVLVIIAVSPRPILEAIIAEGLAQRFFIIGTDSWGVDSSISEGIWSQFRGIITIAFRNAFYSDFLDWVSQLEYNNRKEIPDTWFEEFYQHIHECYLPDAVVKVSKYTQRCQMNLPITTDMLKKYGDSVGITQIAAAYAIGSGLASFHRAHGCAGKSFADCMAQVTDSRNMLFAETLKQKWTLPPSKLIPVKNADPRLGSTFNMELGQDRYWNIGYFIYSVINDNTYAIVGHQHGNEFKVEKNTAGIVSKCPEDEFCDCNLEGTNGPLQQTQPKYMRDHQPRNYFYYDEDTGERIYTWPIWAIAVCVLTCIGLLVGLLLFFYFLIFYPVRGGTTILGFLMMVGLFGIYGVNFAFFLPAAEATCFSRRLLLGIVYSIVFAALLVKAVDNWRFKDTEYSTKRYTGIANPVTLVLIALGIVLIQGIIPTEWLSLRPATASIMENSTVLHDWMWCDPHDFYDISLVLSMVFVVFLVILTAIFSALAWNSESNYYESRWIFVSCVTTAGCFLVWMVVSTSAGAPYRDPAVAVANFVNATALLIYIPLRKLVLLIQFSSEEEKAKSIPMDESNHEVYSTVYTNAEYQPDVFQADYKAVSENGY